jgi:Tle cognate immunity protein 4 C-terminal domain/Tle cognate immunity protein 4 N-terminal domain
MMELTKNMQTHCIGRYLIDLPKEFQSTHPWAILTYGLDSNFKTAELSVVSTMTTPKQFHAAVSKARAEIANKTHETLKTSMLAFESAINEQTYLFRSYKSADRVETYNIDIHILYEDIHVWIKDKAYKGKYAPAEERLQKIAAQIKKANQPISIERGFCLESLLINSDQDQEYADFSFRSTEHADVTVEITTDAISPDPNESVLQRIEGPNSLFKKFGVNPSVLRKGKNKLGEMQAEEWLGKLKDEGRTEIKLVTESTKRAKPGFATPLMHIEINIGQQLPDGSYKPSLWTDQEAIAIWDSIIKSVRLRPGAV